MVSGVALPVTIRILIRTSTAADEVYDVAVPNKTIYVADGDLPVFDRAQQLAGGSLSAAIAKALRRYVDAAEALGEGFDEVTVRVGVGNGRKVRFTGVLVGEWMDTRTTRAERFRVWRGRTGKFVLHTERSPEFWMVDADGKPAGWKGHLGIGNVRYGESPKESTIEVLESIDALRSKVPPELFEMVSRSIRQPTVEDLDI
jgi:EXLDI family protein